MKRSAVVMTSSMLCFAAAVPAHAIGITYVKGEKPGSIKKGKSANYSLTLKYNTVVCNIPLPTTCKLGLELPQSVFKSVKFVTGSAPMTFTKCRGAKTGQNSFQCYKSFRVTGTATKSFTVKGTAVNTAKKSGRGSMGTGNLGFGIKLNEWNDNFSVCTKK